MAIVFGGANEIATFGNLPPGDVNFVSTFGWIGGPVPESIIIHNHVTRALSLLIEEFKRSGGINSIVKVSVEQAQDIEDQGNALLVLRRLEQATGVQLDGLGDIVGIERDGRTDTEYRAAIVFQIFVNTSNAEPETAIRALKFVTQATRVRLWEIQDATMYMFTNGSIIPDNVVSFMDELIASGVLFEYVAASFGTTPFSFALDDFSDNPEGGGFGELEL